MAVYAILECEKCGYWQEPAMSPFNCPTCGTEFVRAVATSYLGMFIGSIDGFPQYARNPDGSVDMTKLRWQKDQSH